MTVLETQGLAARHAARALAVAGTARKNAALEAAARTIEARQGEILAANAADLEAAMAAGLRPALLDRLALDEGRIAGIVEGVRQVAALPDPIGAVTKMDTRPNGLTIGKRRVPLGVIGIIYEARPNVTVDAAALCLKSGNAALLRGGKEAFHSNQAFAAVLRDALEEAGLPRDCVALVADTSRESANELMGLTEYLDVLIPRGGAGLIRSVVENARVPVIQTGVVLREGDVLFIPEYVSTVKINGAVMYPNTVLYKEGENSRYYINQAGGYASNAKKRSAFVVYMNGTVSRLRTGNSKAIEPGCEIIVPSKDPKKRMSAAEIIGMGTSAASLATMIATMVNLFK